MASKGAVREGLFFAQQTPCGALAKNPEGTSRCNAAGAYWPRGLPRADGGPGGGLAKGTERTSVVRSKVRMLEHKCNLRKAGETGTGVTFRRYGGGWMQTGKAPRAGCDEGSQEGDDKRRA